MKKKDFIIELTEYLELDHASVDENSILKNIEGFDSMAIMSLIAFCDEKFSKQFSAQQLQSITSIKVLMELIGLENFED